MANAWKAMGPSLFAGDERINAMLSNMAIEKVDELTYCLPLLNSLQQDEMMRLRPKMLQYLVKTLRNTGVKIQFRIVEQEQTAVAFTAEERLKLLQQMNPQLQALRQSLGLSLD